MASLILDSSESSGIAEVNDISHSSTPSSSISAPTQEKIVEVVSQGLFAKEYKAVRDIINSYQTKIDQIYDLYEKPPNCWMKHRKKIIVISSLLMVSGLLAAIILEPTGSHFDFWSLKFAGFGCLGVGVLSMPFYLHHDKQVHEEMSLLRTARLGKENQIKHLNLVLVDAYYIQKFYNSWTKFEKAPNENQIPRLIEKFSTLSGVTQESKLFFMDEICKKLQQGTVVKQWDAYKSFDGESDQFPAEPWKTLALDKPAFEVVVAYRKLAAENRDVSIVDTVIESTKKRFGVEQFLAAHEVQVAVDMKEEEEVSAREDV